MSAATLATLSRPQRRAIAGLFSGLRITRPILNFVRVLPRAYDAAPLGFGNGLSRFSPLATTPVIRQFGLIYGTVNLATAAYEAIIRDSFDLRPPRILRYADYADRSAVNFSTAPGQSLTLLDLTDGNAVRFGVPTDVMRFSQHSSGQYFSEFVYAEMPDVDGILYSSRFTELTCVVVYDRAIQRKLIGGRTPLWLGGASRTLASALAPWNVQVLPPPPSNPPSSPSP